MERALDTATDRRAADGDPVDMTRVLVSIPSVNPGLEPGGAGEEGVARRCARWLEAWGFETRVEEIEPGRCNVIARHGSGPGPAVMLNGHLDTVGVAGMSVDPFAAEVVEGRLYGRGACDMKAGVAALLAAARRVARRSHVGSLVVALTADEEHASIGMQSVVQSGVRADLAVVCEPTSLAVMPAHKGFVWVRLVFRGRAAHGSRPREGIDAVRHAGKLLAHLDDLDADIGSKPAHALLGHGSVHAGTIAGGTAPSVYPDRCELVLERRTLPGEGPEDALAEVEALVDRVRREEPELDVTVDVTLARPATEVGGDTPLVTGLLAATREQGREPRVAPMTAWVDAAFLNEAGIPAVCYGPGSIAQAHSADEWVDVDEIRACADVLERFCLHHLA